MHSTEQCVHSNSAWFCGPKEALEDSHVHSAHTFCFTHGGHRDEHLFPFFPQLLNEIKDDLDGWAGRGSAGAPTPGGQRPRKPLGRSGGRGSAADGS